MTQYYKKNDDGEFVECDLAQEDINQAVKERVDRVNRKYADYDSLKETIEKMNAKQREDEDRINGLLTDKANLEDEVKAAKLETDKVKIMSEFKLNEDMAEFVTGETVEEMRGRAEKLVHNIKTPTLETTKEAKPEPKKSGMQELADNLFKSQE